MKIQTQENEKGVVMRPTITVSHISKTFGEVKAVNDVSFDVYPGEIFGLLGPNGAGKTTSIRMMLDIFRPETGTISIFGGQMNEEMKNRIGYLPEERGLYKDLKLEQTLVFLATLKGMDEKTAKSELVSWLECFDLYEHRQKKIQDLSRGMQQKAQFIATLVHDPDLVVVDEPFSGLDPVNTRLVKNTIMDLCNAGKTIIMSTHQMHQVETMCNRIVLINAGRTVLYGEVEKIKRDFAGNAVVIEGQGNFSAIPGVLETRQENGEVHLILDGETSPQDVFRFLAQGNDVQIERFEIAEPSLDDIFISVVQGDGPIGSQNA
jgi:ABC-2 type transport system ATP-binding protein